VPPAATSAFLIALSYLPLTWIDRSEVAECLALTLTVRLRSIPEHNTAERRKGITHLFRNTAEGVYANISASSCARGGRSSDVNLDVLVGTNGACPSIPDNDEPVS
jgi:hypothetical protein